MKLRGLIPNFYIHVRIQYVIDLYISTISAPILPYCICESTVGIYINRS
jgi:hypothetical protein